MALFSKATPTSLPDKVPEHVAIIMDGNGRWAKARGLPRAAGHKKGADALKNILQGCRDLKLKHLTIYAFSSENWSRPEEEVSDLMQLLRHYLAHEIEALHKNGIRLSVIGNREKLADDIRKQIEAAEAKTAGNDALTLTVALSYGAREEMVRAMRQIARKVETGEIAADALDEALISKTLDTHAMPDPDLLIRTGGEHRLSNFLLWQSAYTELFFTPTLWPDFTPEHFSEALHEYAKRERRYGNTGN